MSNPAENYEAYFVPALFGPSAARLVEAARLRGGERVLDVACGTAAALRAAAPYVGPNGVLAGVDINPNMLAIAREVAQRDGLTLELHEAPAEALPLSDGSFDLVVCSQGLQFFPDKPTALSEMRRVLTVGGRVAVSVWQDLSHHPFHDAQFEAIERHLGIPGAKLPFSLGDEAELRALLADAGFESIEIEQASITARFPDPERFLVELTHAASAAIPAMQQLDEAERQGVIDAVTREMEPRVSALVVDDHVTLPHHAHLVHAIRP